MAKLPDGVIYTMESAEKGTTVKFKYLQDLVMCKNCRYKDETESPYWELWCKRNDRSVDGNWFCADGERQEEHDDGR